MDLDRGADLAVPPAVSGVDLLHIGYPRTGTTLLQQYVLPRLGEWLKERQLTVHSDEGLSGDVFHDDIGAARRLREENPNARVMICIRSQRTIIPSIYSIYIKAGGTLNYGDFVATLIPRRKFYYFDLIREYSERFSADNVLVLLYEDLVHDREEFLGDLFAFCGLDQECMVVCPEEPVNPRWSDGYIRATRAINWITGFPYSIHHEKVGTARRRARHLLQALYLVFERVVTRLLGRPVFLIDFATFDHAIEDAYREQNRKLCSELAVPVDAYGYPGFPERDPLSSAAKRLA